jgi:hypothetical protein
MSLSSQKYGFGIRDPEKKPIPDLGSGFKGQKDTGFRIRIRNLEKIVCTSYKFYNAVTMYRKKRYQQCIAVFRIRIDFFGSESDFPSRKRLFQVGSKIIIWI